MVPGSIKGIPATMRLTSRIVHVFGPATRARRRSAVTLVTKSDLLVLVKMI